MPPKNFQRGLIFDDQVQLAQAAFMPRFRQSRYFAFAGLVVFALSLWLAFFARLQPENVPIFWPPAGVMLALLVGISPRHFWTTFIGLMALTFLGKASVGLPPSLNLLLTLNEGAVGLLGTWAYRTWISAHPASTIKALGRFLVIAVVLAVLSASVGSLIVNQVQGTAIASIWHHWLGALVHGFLIATPLLVLLSDNPENYPHIRFDQELTFVIVAAVVLLVVAHAPLLFSTPLRLAAVILIIPLLLWTAVRRSAFETSLFLSIASMTKITALAKGWGTFEVSSIPEGTSWLMAVFAIQSGVVLLLSANRSEQQKSDRQRSVQTARLMSAIDASNDGIVSIDVNGNIETFSASAERLFGYTSDEVVGQNVKILMPDNYAVEHDGYMDRYLHTGEKRIIGIGRLVTGKRKDGSEFPMELSVGEAFSGPYHVFTGFIRDVSERQETEQRLHELQGELLHVSRLSAMGELASALAHELNQPLTAIKNYAQTASILLKSNSAEKLPEIMTKTAEQAGRAGDIIKRMRTFVTAKQVEKAPQKVSQLIEEACALALVGAREEGIKSRILHGTNLPDVSVDRIQIQQILINLIRNAVDAVRNGPSREVTIRSSLEEQHIVIEVIDTGPGVSEQGEKSLFKPFMTTKPGGMGIGLSLSRSIAEAHGGTLTYAHSPAGGAIFTLALPCGTDENEKQPNSRK